MQRGANFENIRHCREFSEKKLADMTEALADFEQEGISVVLNGSFSRLEASDESDVDFFVLAPEGMSKETGENASARVRQALGKVVSKPPSEGGPFGTVEQSGTFARTIGGAQDDNPSITRRILFLTEGRPVIGCELFEHERDSLVRKYVRETISDHQLTLFLLNDIIRYYRTVCVDFEHKTIQGDKPWGTRNIKLVFSRKMLYFGGVLICAETAQQTFTQKLAIAKKLMAMTPIERVSEICGSAADRALGEYDYFLGEMAKPEVRDHLATIPEDRLQHTELFKTIKNRGRQFSMCLMSALCAAYPPFHPIHRALIM
jgi:predicted nucleotidyltransferase